MGFLRAIVERLPGSWQLANGHGFALGAIAAADLPACNHSRDGEKRRIPGAAGTADREVVCEKDAADAYAWEDKGEAAMNTANDARYVNVAGDTMTGLLTVPSFAVAGTFPVTTWTRTDASANAGIYRSFVETDGTFYIQAVNDAGSTFLAPLTMSRTGGTPTGVHFAYGASIGGGASIVKVLSGTATWDPGSIANGAASNAVVTVTGAAIGDPCFVGYTSLTAGLWMLSAYVFASDTAQITLVNNTGSAVDLPSGTVRVVTFKF